MAKIFSSDLAFDPTKDSLTKPDGTEFRFLPPKAKDLPSSGYDMADEVYAAPPTEDRGSIDVVISPTSERLQRLKPFAPWAGSDYDDCVVLIKVKGKCTTDHITPAGPWFRFRGHLANISNNTLIGAINAENDKVNTVQNWLSDGEGSVPETARAYKELSQPWVIIGDHNYGEGSSREHAALQPRFLGGVAVIAKSFARIHQTNLKKQGMLALTFVDEGDYDRLVSSDRVSIKGLAELTPGRKLTLRVSPTDGRGGWETELAHTFTSEEVEYFKAGSALNLMANRKAAEARA